MAFVAGAVNAGGFMSIGVYTSHMTGILSSVADNAALGAWPLVALGGFSLLTAVVLAAVTAPAMFER